MSCTEKQRKQSVQMRLFFEIIDNMNANSAIPDEIRPTLKLHQLQVYRWFVDDKGLEKST